MNHISKASANRSANDSNYVQENIPQLDGILQKKKYIIHDSDSDSLQYSTRWGWSTTTEFMWYIDCT